MSTKIFPRLELFLLGCTITAGLLFAPAVFGQTTGDASNITEEQISSALKDLSEIYGSPVTTAEQAKTICNTEKFLTLCADIGKQHNLYEPEELEQVNGFLEEIKGTIAEELQRCADEACLLGVATRLSEQIVSNKPELATEFNLTKEKIEEKQVVIEAAQEIGVSFSECHEMDPDTASVELLRACARLAKDSRVQEYIPEDLRERVATADPMIELQIALKEGQYECGDGTPDSCGDFCLNPSDEALAQGNASIPPVCLQIAEDFFGEEGVRELEGAYSKIREVEEYYKSRVDDLVFTTLDGRKLYSPEEIGQYLEGEAEKGNIAGVEKGMDFLISQGFINPEEKEFALKMIRKMSEFESSRGFDECSRNPQACEEFIPEDLRQEFSVMEEIHNLMIGELQQEGVPSPEFCDDPQYGDGCLRAGKRALPLIEELAGDFPPARAIVEEIKFHIEEGERGFGARDRAREEFDREGGKIFIGERQFTDFDELDEFCAANGSVCLAEAAKKGFIDRDFAADKFERSYEHQYEYNQYGPPGPPDFFGDDEYLGDQFNFGFGYNDDFGPQGPRDYFTQPDFFGPGPRPSIDNKEELLRKFENWLDNPEGAPPIPYDPYYDPYSDPYYQPHPKPYEPRIQEILTPEVVNCMQENGIPKAMIEKMSSGDPGGKLARKMAYKCHDETQPYPPYPPPYVCDVEPAPCPRGSYRQVIGGEYGNCPNYGECIPSGTVCPEVAASFYEQCPEGEHREFDITEQDCKVPGDCVPGIPDYCAVIDPYTRECAPGEKPVKDECGNPSCYEAVPPTSVQFPHYFSDGFIAKDYETLKIHCYDNPPGSGGGIAGECEKLGIVYDKSGGDEYSCPGFAYSRWDNRGVRYCQLNNTISCEYNYPAYLDAQNYSGENCPREESTDWVSKTWTFSDGSTEQSSILNRTDTEYLNYIKEVEAQCRTIPRSEFQWMPDAGNDNDYNWRNFGIPNCSDSSITPTGNCQPGYHYHSENSGYCMNDAEDYNGICYNLDGVTKITCPSYGPPGDSCGTYSNNKTTCEATSGCNWRYPAGSSSGGWCEPVADSGGCYNYTDPTSCTAVTNCYWDTYCYYGGPTTEPTDPSTCPSGFHWHGDSGGYCINDADDYSGTCYDSSGTTTITCPSYTSGGCGTSYNSASCTSKPDCDWYTPSTGSPYCISKPTVDPYCEMGGFYTLESCNAQVDCEWITSSSGGSGYCKNKPTTTTDPSVPPKSEEGCSALRSWCDSYWSPTVDNWGIDSTYKCAKDHNSAICVSDPAFSDVDPCFTEFGTGWEIQELNTGNCYDQYSPQFRTLQGGTIYSCNNIPVGMSAPGCTQTTTTTTTTQTTSTTTTTTTTPTTTTTTSTNCSTYTNYDSCEAISTCRWYGAPGDPNGYCTPDTTGGTSGSSCTYTESGGCTSDPTCSWTGTSCIDVGSCGSYNDSGSCTAQPNCNWFSDSSGSYCYYGGPTTEPTDPNTCPSGFHWHGDSGGYCINDADDYSGTCYDSTGTNVITCPASTPTGGGGSCPSGFHYHSDSGGYCINDQEDYNGTCYDSSGTTTITCPSTSGSTTACNYNGICDSGESSGSCPADCSSGSGSSSCNNNYYCDSTESYSTCPSDCTQSGGSNSGVTCPSTEYNDYTTGNNCSYSMCPNGCMWDSQSCPIGCDNPGSGGSSCNYDGTCDSSEDSSCSDCTTTSGGGDSMCNYDGVCNGSETEATCSSDCYTPPPASDPATDCVTYGGTWNASTNMCDMPGASLFSVFKQTFRPFLPF